MVKLKAIVFGSFNDSDLYLRNRVLLGCAFRLFEETKVARPRVYGRSRKWENIYKRMLREAWYSCRRFLDLYSQRSAIRKADVVFVPYPPFLDLYLLQPIGRRLAQVVIIDAFLGLHETVVNDRKLVSEAGFLARLLAWIERRTLIKADHILIDTEQQRAMMIAQYGIHPSKISAIPVGLDERIWIPLPRRDPPQVLRALFWGTFIPLHGIETIIEAAQILEGRMQVEIRLIGDGQTADAVEMKLAESKLDRVYWRKELVGTDDLRREIAECDVVLGIFGSSRKAGNVIPYKVHQALASNRPVITRESDALKYVDASFPQLVRVPAADPLALADAIQSIAGPVKKGSIPDTRGIYDRYFGSSVVQSRFNEAIAKAIKASP